MKKYPACRDKTPGLSLPATQTFIHIVPNKLDQHMASGGRGTITWLVTPSDKMNITRKCHIHRSQTNLWHQEEERL